uniref:Uncharacterized protein n=1 Tax=Candidatus Kentrum sp. LPFa TaxID=2126335 RepID=A0A450VMR4_9GAMM|nr:MAG: hypothetical protein BECKLPF1236A_GA0070988_1000124 [Candidatus Kentron sp. LPFa]VFK22653.1 MAG: hypothetical protein BECKLPF1236C_GA0070990_1000127 [Candidatus Kentron sp. LPFa]
MGQFLAIGLATRVSAKKTEVDESQLDIEQLQEEMKAKLYYAPEIYVANDNNDSSYEFILKDDVLYPQLIPFLKTIYIRFSMRTRYITTI